MKLAGYSFYPQAAALLWYGPDCNKAGHIRMLQPALE